MKILIACEESQAVTIEFRKLGFEAYSCDMIECSGVHPEWHIKGDAIKEAYSGKYGMMIAFPPCTYLTLTGNRWFKPEYKERYPDRERQRKEAIKFFLQLINAPIDKIAIENPIGIMSTKYKKPSQIIQPYYFGDKAQKTTCLWLKGLNPLFHAKEKDLFNNEITHVDKGEFFEWIDSKTGRKKRQPQWYYEARKGDHSKNRSKTFPGIAKAMAEQWH